MASSFEDQYVHNTYHSIASQFDQTRRKVWSSTIKVLSELAKNLGESPRIIEVGAGNGRNLDFMKQIKPNAELVAVEPCSEFCQLMLDKNTMKVHQGRHLELPSELGTFDLVLSIAVIHHLSTRERRLEALRELVQLTRYDGLIVIQVWACRPTSAKSSRLQWKIIDEKTSDYLIPWQRVQKDGMIYKRFYHLFVEGELEELVSELEGVKIVHSFRDNENWGIILQRQLGGRKSNRERI